MAWTIDYSDSVLKQLKKLDKPVAKKVLAYMDERIAVLEDPATAGKPLTGRLGNLHRYRVGDIRVVCFISKETVSVLVLRVAHRSKVYEDEDKFATKASSEVNAFLQRKEDEDSEKELAEGLEYLDKEYKAHIERQERES